MTEIRDYSLSQFNSFLEAISILEKNKIKIDTIIYRASQADKKEFKNFLKEIDK